MIRNRDRNPKASAQYELFENTSRKVAKRRKVRKAVIRNRDRNPYNPCYYLNSLGLVNSLLITALRAWRYLASWRENIQKLISLRANALTRLYRGMILPENYRGTLTGRGLPAGLSMPTLTTAANSANGVKKN